jgi:two-component system, chemotaxis family, sensor kinase CheA
MSVVDRISIRIKLALLAVVPVAGAVLLAILIVHDARQRAATSAVLGSFDDLARLSERMNAVMHAMQHERSATALLEGRVDAKDKATERAPESGDSSPTSTPAAPLGAIYRATDTTIDELETFLSQRDISKLPPRLARDLTTARAKIAQRTAIRERVSRHEVSLEETVGFYHGINEALIGATAALAYLSDDGELLRGISALVAMSELSERYSVEHALLAHVFAADQFPPGSYKTLVTIVTEEKIYADVFRANAIDEHVGTYEEVQSSESARRADGIRHKAMTTTDETLGVDPEDWSTAESERLERLRAIEQSITSLIATAATQKMIASRDAVRFGIGLSTVIVCVSVLLASLVARGITRTIVVLDAAVSRVQQTKDFGIRARRTSDDELGSLTDAFNEMLAGIQARDAELAVHRSTLEQMVEARTAQLASRNEATRLVLDNVVQGLAMVGPDGTLGAERSAAFDALVGTPALNQTFSELLGANDPRLKDVLELGWSLVVDDVFPLDVAIEQLPKSIVRDGVQLDLAFQPIVRDGRFDGALLVVTDVTADVAARAETARQAERLAVFERVVQDRDGFLEFATEMNALFEDLASSRETRRTMATIHTIKGNSAQWDVMSVASGAHALEAAVADRCGEPPTPAEIQALHANWRSIHASVRDLVGSHADKLEVSREDIDQLLNCIHSGAAPEALTAVVESLKNEPARVRFQRMADQVAHLARRVGKPMPKIEIDAGSVRLPTAPFGGFWSAAVHVLRNMLDHGIEPALRRIEAGKSPAGTLWFSASESPAEWKLVFEDDGRGIDWGAVAAKAQAVNLPASTHADLEAALFSAGLTTAQTVTEISGRGVGLTAVRDVCRSLGATIAVESEGGRGTRFVFRFPRPGRETVFAERRRTMRVA